MPQSSASPAQWNRDVGGPRGAQNGAIFEVRIAPLYFLSYLPFVQHSPQHQVRSSSLPSSHSGERHSFSSRRYRCSSREMSPSIRGGRRQRCGAGSGRWRPASAAGVLPPPDHRGCHTRTAQLARSFPPGGRGGWSADSLDRDRTGAAAAGDAFGMAVDGMPRAWLPLRRVRRRGCSGQWHCARSWKHDSELATPLSMTCQSFWNMLLTLDGDLTLVEDMLCGY